MALSAHMRMRRRTRTEDSAQVHQTLFLLLGVGSGDETSALLALELQADVDGSFSTCSLQFSLCMMIATLVSSLIHSPKTVLAMSAEDGGISSTRQPFVVYTTSGNNE